MRSHVFQAGVLVVIIASACTTGEVASPESGAPAQPEAPAPVVNAVTFHKDIRPILETVCQKCHVAGGIAPFTLVTYQDAKDWAAAIVAETQARRMPPWGARTTDECTPPHPWKDDIRLTEPQLAAIDAWHAGGDLEGNPADAPKVPVAAQIALANATTIAPTTPYQLDPQAKRDIMECFVMDPQITSTKYLNGTYFVPTNKTIVHHALAFAIPPGAVVPGERYECFGGPRVTGASLIGTWAPGALPAEYPPNVGRPVEPGTRFVMQVHYHPHANATPEPDQTQFHYRLTDTEPDWLAQTRLIGNFRKAAGENSEVPAGVTAGLLPGPNDPASGVEFLIPAGVKDHVETMTFTFPVGLPDVRIAGLGGHMHLAGYDEKVTLKRIEGDTQCLLHEPSWDFNWQRGYAYDVPIESLPILRGGDSIDIRCTYNNTMQNRKLAPALLEAGLSQPQPITLGEETIDEMCLAGFVFLRKNPN